MISLVFVGHNHECITIHNDNWYIYILIWCMITYYFMIFHVLSGWQDIGRYKQVIREVSCASDVSLSDKVKTCRGDWRLTGLASASTHFGVLYIFFFLSDLWQLSSLYRLIRVIINCWLIESISNTCVSARLQACGGSGILGAPLGKL